jgi:hypothetical protein
MYAGIVRYVWKWRSLNAMGGIVTMAKRKSSGVARPMDDGDPGPHQPSVRKKKKKSKSAKKAK